MSGLDQLRKALREVVGSSTGGEELEADEAEGGPHHGKGHKLAPAEVRAQREKKRQSRSFCTTSRDHVTKLDVGARFRAPPVGSYRPKEELCQPRVKGHVDFSQREATRSRTTMAIEREVEGLQADGLPFEHLTKNGVSVELLDETPSRMDRKSPEWDLGKLSPRPDMIKQSGIVYNNNSFTANVLDGDLSTSLLTRQPCFDFAKTSVYKVKDRETYFQPGQYKTGEAFDSTRPRLEVKNAAFENQRPRKGLAERPRAGDHLPDRSLTRSIGLGTMTRSTPLLSSEMRVTSPQFSKYTVRPAFWKDVPEYHRRDDPETDRVVMQRQQTFDASDADRLCRRRALTTEKFDKSLTRAEHFKVQRSYGEDICMQRVKDNVVRGPVSVELLSDVGNSPQNQRRIRNLRDFVSMEGREGEKRYGESPARNREQGGAMKFERSQRDGDSRCEVQVFSPLAGGISGLRSTRSVDGIKQVGVE